MSSLLHDLGIEPGALLVNAVSFIILLWLMKRFVFGPVGSFIEQRKQRIAQTIEDAEADRAKAAEERAEIERRRAELLEAARKAAEAVKAQAEREASEVKAAAREEARRLQHSARETIRREREQVAEQLRDHVGVTAAAMCRRILERSLDDQRQRALLDQFISHVESLATELQSQQ